MLEVRRVVRHEGQIVDEGYGSYHQVRSRYGNSLLKQCAPHPSEFLRALPVKVNQVNFLTYVRDQTQKPIRLRMFVGSRVKLCQGHG